MRKIILSLLACIVTFPLSAQYEKYLADPSITWAAEIDLLLTPDGDDYTWPADSLNTSTVLKSVSTEPENSPYRDPKPLIPLLFEAIGPATPIFADPRLQHRLPDNDWWERIYVGDTIISVDPQTHDTILSLASRCWTYQDIRFLKVRQLLLYRDQTASFELITLAVAPVVGHWKTPFWLAVPANKSRKKPRLDDADIIWARRLTTKGASPDISAVHSVRQPEKPLLPGFIEQVRTNPRVVILNSDWKRSPFPERDYLLGINRTDTVEFVDTHTYETRTRIVHSDLDINKLHHLRLIQDWYWDDRLKRLHVRLAAVAPMVDVRADDGSFRYERPLFYRTGE